jgi:PIN domain-containing protein
MMKLTSHMTSHTVDEKGEPWDFGNYGRRRRGLASSWTQPLRSCFRETARRMVGQQEDLFYDAMIAATAHLHGLTVAMTRNEKDFRHLNVGVINPFKSN